MTLPKEFEEYTHKLMGDDLYQTLKHSLQENPPTSIRINPFKGDLSNFGTPVPWCPYGFYLPNRPAFTFDPMLHAGLYYVQESSSMFICEVARQLIKEPVMMLDLCAAPGGKSTALRSVLPSKSILFTNEPIKTRASILKENIVKFGHPDVIVTNNYPREYAKAKLLFDAILADVPCSGEGMFRKDPNAISEWSTSNVEKCALLQRSIIEDIWKCLKPGGILIYSTCTFNAHEDEDNVAWISEKLGADLIALDIPDKWKITGSLTTPMPVYRFIPGKTPGEGLFLAVLRKHGTKTQTEDKEKLSFKQGVKSKATTTKGTSWLKENFCVFQEKDTITAIPMWWQHIYNNVRDKLHVIHAGVKIGTIKGKDLVPDTSLALSIALKDDAFHKAELDYDTAIRFLRKEAITLPPDYPLGFIMITYKGQPLGFVKNIGNRANNLYPQEWKIKSSHIPT